MTKLTTSRRGLFKAALAGAALAGGSAAGVAAGPAAAAVPAAATVPDKVPRKPLGATGASVPILQLGTSQSLDATYDKRMHRCLAEGVDYFDTALSYGWGRSHSALATFLEQVGDRGKLWITSKSGAGSPEGLERGLDEALAGLRTDYLDLYFMHGIDDEDMLEPAFLKAGERMRRSGKTRFFGFSCHDGNVVGLMNKAARVGGIDAILFRYHFGRYGDRALNKAIDACKQAGIGLIAMKVMRSVPSGAEQVVRFRSERFTLAQAKLKAVWADERIDSLCSEMASVEQVRENVAAAKSAVALSAGEMHQLQQLAARTAHLHCDGCRAICEPLAGGRVAVADTLRFLMYHESYGDTERARRLYRALPEAARDLAGVDFAAATAACPQGIDIAGRLEQARRELA
jgi:hypothetical protein